MGSTRARPARWCRRRSVCASSSTASRPSDRRSSRRAARRDPRTRPGLAPSRDPPASTPASRWSRPPPRRQTRRPLVASRGTVAGVTGLDGSGVADGGNVCAPTLPSSPCAASNVRCPCAATHRAPRSRRTPFGATVSVEIEAPCDGWTTTRPAPCSPLTGAASMAAFGPAAASSVSAVPSLPRRPRAPGPESSHGYAFWTGLQCPRPERIPPCADGKTAPRRWPTS